MKEIIRIPNYKYYLSIIDSGKPLYYFSLYVKHKITNRQQLIDAMAYGVKIYTQKEVRRTVSL